jgi:hypothetical protein
MLIAVWVVALGFSLFGGIWLLPYKTVSNVEPTVVLALTIAFFLFGLIGGRWILNSTFLPGLNSQLLLSTIFSLSGVIGIAVNFAQEIEGLPVLSVISTSMGIGGLGYWLAKNYRGAI